MEEIDKNQENVENATESVSKKQKVPDQKTVANEGAHWITGDLGKLCVIM